MKTRALGLLTAVLALTIGAAWLAAQDKEAASPATKPAAAAMDAKHAELARKTMADAVAFILKNRREDGGWGFAPDKNHPGLTAMCIKALAQAGYKSDSPELAKALEALMKMRQDTGGFYDPKEGNENYCTSLAVMALAAAKSDKHKAQLDDALKFLRGQQIVVGSKTPGGQEIAKGDPREGGVSYGTHGRPDLSNVGFWMEAMHEAGVSGDDEAMQRAVGFVKRLQNRSEGSEGQSFVLTGVEDGGFIYAVDFKDGKFVGESMGGDTDRGLRSYGSMTYTGFKSMLYANVKKDDPRVKAAYEWIRKYWRLDSNPNMPSDKSLQGLYYYYNVFAKALRQWGQDVIVDAKGDKHNWREELIDAVSQRQQKDGSWTNDADRWMEGNPVLVSCYCVMALQEATAKP